MHGNFFDENIAAIFLKMLVSAKHITKFTVPHTLPIEIVDKFALVTSMHGEKKVWFFVLVSWFFFCFCCDCVCIQYMHS